MKQSSDILSLLNNPATSYWLREAIKSAFARDPLDSLQDAETLVELLQQRLATLQAPPPEKQH